MPLCPGSYFCSLGINGNGCRPQRVKALLVDLTGKVNPRPCVGCINKFRRSVSVNMERINWPSSSASATRTKQTVPAHASTALMAGRPGLVNTPTTGQSMKKKIPVIPLL